MPPYRVFNILSHAVTSLLLLAFTPRLYRRVSSTSARRAVLTFSLTSAATYAVSSVYHASHVTENEAEQRVLEQADHVGIFAAVAGSYTPLVVLGAPSALRLPALSTLWSLAATGMGIEGLNAGRLSRWLSAVTYLLLGSAGLRFLPMLRLSAAARRWMLLGQLLTALGAVVYKKQQPNPWPRYIGSHGVWHVLSALGSGASYLAVLAATAPPGMAAWEQQGR